MPDRPRRRSGEALWSAITGPAHYFGLEREAGAVAAGMRADLVLLDRDPLADIRNTAAIRVVVAGGRLFDRPALNVPIALAMLAGYGAVTAGRASAVAYAWVVAGSGLFAAAFHAWHLAGGDRAFRAPVSLALLVDTALLSLAQAALLVRHHRWATRTRAAAA